MVKLTAPQAVDKGSIPLQSICGRVKWIIIPDSRVCIQTLKELLVLLITREIVGSTPISATTQLRLVRGALHFMVKSWFDTNLSNLITL